MITATVLYAMQIGVAADIAEGRIEYYLCQTSHQYIVVIRMNAIVEMTLSNHCIYAISVISSG